jgi:hypothetical protein
MTPNQPITHGEMTQMMEIIEKNAEHSESIANSLKSLSESMTAISSIKKDIEYVKIIVGAVGLVIVIATVILRGIDNRRLFKSEVKEIVQELKVGMPSVQE